MTKVLIAIDHDLVGNFAYAHNLRFARDLCYALGYEYDVRCLTNNSQFLEDVSAYEFAICPAVNHYGGWSITDYWVKLFDGSLGIPCFVLCIRDETDNAVTKTHVEFNGSTDSRLCYWDTTPIYTYCATFDIESGYEDDITPIITTSSGGSGQMVMWRYDGGTSPVYFNSSRVQANDTTPENHSLFAIMLQEAINNGDIAAPAKKLHSYFDLDDFPDASNTLTEVQTLAATLAEGSLPLTIGLMPNVTPQSGVPAYIASRTAWFTSTATWFWPIIHHPSQHMDDAKATVESEIDASAATCKAQGFAISKYATPYWYYPNNRFNKHTLQLQTPRTNYLASGDDSTKKKGWGGMVARAEGSINNSYPGDWPEPVRSLKYRQRVYDVRIVASTGSMSGQKDPATTLGIQQLTALTSDWMVLGMFYGQPIYIHGHDLYDGHDGGYAIGQFMLDTFVDIANRLTDVHSFEHASALAAM